MLFKQFDFQNGVQYKIDFLNQIAGSHFRSIHAHVLKNIEPCHLILFRVESPNTRLASTENLSYSY